jgi:hypothetical protein
MIKTSQGGLVALFLYFNPNSEVTREESEQWLGAENDDDDETGLKSNPGRTRKRFMPKTFLQFPMGNFGFRA